MSHQSDLPPHVPSCVSTGAGVTVPDATATPRTDANTGKAIAGHYGPSDSTDLYACPGGPFVHADFARTLERELTEAKADNESLRTLWTEIRTVLIQSRAANCVCSYGAQQADAVEAANAVLKRMPPDVTNERDQLRSRVAELEQELKATQKQANDEFDAIITRNMELEKDLREDRHLSKLADENLVLMKRITELEQDKARLDWLEDNGHLLHICCWHHSPAKENEWTIHKGDFDGEPIGADKLLRAAIDAAKGQP